MKINGFIKLCLIFTTGLVIAACGGTSGGGGNANPANNIPPYESAAIKYTLPNGTVIYSPVSTLNVIAGESVSTTVSIFGGSPGLVITLGSVESSSDSSINSKSGTNCSITGSYTPPTLISGSSVTTSDFTINSSGCTSAETITVSLTASVTTAEGTTTVTIGQIAVNLSAAGTPTYGNLSVNPTDITFTNVGNTESIALTLSGESNVSDFNLNVAAASANTNVVTVINSTCNFTQNGVCNISLQAVSPGSTMINFTLSDNSHYQILPVMVTVLSPGTSTYGSLSVNPTHVFFHHADGAESIALTLSGESNVSDFNLNVTAASADTNIVTVGNSTCAFTQNGVCNISLQAVSAGSTTISLTPSDTTHYQTQTITVTVSAQYAYAVNRTGNSILMYSLNESNGGLTPLSPPSIQVEGSGLDSIAVSPSGRYVYAVGETSNRIYLYDITESNGILVAPSNNQYVSLPVGYTTYPQNISIDPSGSFLYVAVVDEYDDGYIAMYSINQNTGALTPLDPEVMTTGGTNPRYAVFNPVYPYVYAPDSGDGKFVQFGFSTTTGLLSQLSPFTIDIEDNASGLTFDNTGKYAYVSDFGLNTIYMYSVNPSTGLSSPLTTESIGIDAPNQMLFGPSGRYLYAVQNDYVIVTGITVFSQDSATGLLTFVSQVPILANFEQPLWMTFDHFGRYAFVTTSKNNNGKIIIYAVDENNGALTQSQVIDTGSSLLFQIVFN